jgi:hypothetical protein
MFEPRPLTRLLSTSTFSGKRHEVVADSIEGMSRRYIWRKETFAMAVESAGKMSRDLQRSLEDHDTCHGLHHQCLQILEWGGLPGVSSAWLRLRCADGSLGKSVSRAVSILKEGRDLGEFDGERLVMNSGLTKIYAMAAPDDLIIYDGRVGAAFGLLVRRSLASAKKVPDELQFPWGSGQGQYTLRSVSSRNPSKNGLIFPYFDNSDASHANWCHRASAILRAVRDRLGGKHSLRAIEMGLFMIGYAVQGLD